MPVYKDEERGTWMVSVSSNEINDNGKRKRKVKRGFKSKREASEWERDFLNKLHGRMEMKFKDFVEEYRRNQGPRIKISTEATKDNIIENKILPFFGDLEVSSIKAVDVIRWQNEMMTEINPKTGKPYSRTYLKTIQNQLSAIFNHAVRIYGLEKNPAKIAGSMGSKDNGEMKFWTKEEYMKFAEVMMDRPKYYYAFEVLYWCGLREGELLALSEEDIDLINGLIHVNKTYYHLKGADYIGLPKTANSKRDVLMPDFLTSELEEYIEWMKTEPGYSEKERLFGFSKSALTREIKIGANLAGVQEIRVHDLRHSHVSLLIHMGYSAVSIAKRVGHKSIDITYRYAHMFPGENEMMAGDLNKTRNEDDNK